MAVTVITSGNSVTVTTAQRVAGAVPCDPATVENSDQSYQENVASGATEVIPDITVGDSLTKAAAVSFDITTWDDMISVFGRGYEYPQPTGLLTSYRTGDDKDIEDTIFGATNRQAQTFKARNTLASFLVLNNNNSWGNTNRFTAEDGTQTYTNNLVIDNYTGLMFYIVDAVAATWNNAIDNALASTQGGFSDWFLPNTMQLISAGEHYTRSIWLNSLQIAPIPQRWTSTTDSFNSANAWQIYNNPIRLFQVTKVTAKPYIICRKHF